MTSSPARVVTAVVAWLVTRFVLFEATLHAGDPSAFRAGAQDVESYRRWSELLWQGSFPVDDATFQYPPGAGLLFMAFGTSADQYLRFFTVGALAADAAVLVMLMLSATRSRGGSWRGPWAWIVGGLLVGPILLLRFDIFAAALAVAAVLLVAYPRLLGVAAGLGAFVKVWPGLTLLAVPRRELPRAAAAAAVTVAASWLAVAILWDESFAFLSQMNQRGLQIESTAALPFLVWRAVDPGAWVPDQRFGSVEVVSPFASAAATVSMLVGIAVLAVILAARITGRLERVPGGDVVLAATLAFVVFNKVNSPQFGVWLVGMAAAALACTRSRMLPAVLATVLAVAVTDRVIADGVGGYGALIDGDPVLVLAQGLRLVLLVLAAGYALVTVLGAPRFYARPQDLAEGNT